MPVWNSLQYSFLGFLLRDERRYARRWIRRLKLGRRHSTLGNDLKDEALTRHKAEQWLAYMRAIGLKSEHRCIEIGCGSLWAAEPIIRYLEPGKYVGLDITEYFYELGRVRLGSLLKEKRVELARMSDTEIARQAEIPADYLFARKVLAHVLPDELPDFMSICCRLLGPKTIGVIDNPMTALTRYRNPGTLAYALADIAPHIPAGIECTQNRYTIILRRETAPTVAADAAGLVFMNPGPVGKIA
jgi:SAM-dependent methyltransferase